MRKWGYVIPLLLPLLVIAGIEAGGAWTWLPVLFVFGIVPLLDLIVPRDKWNPEPEATSALEQQKFYRYILYAWVPLQFAVLAYVLLHVGHTSLNALELAGIVASTGTLTGGIGITIAHELGHKLDRREQWLGRLLLMSVCYMHFHIEHNRGHHAHVATPSDPATARNGQSLYRFLPQTVLGSFRSAWQFERERLARHDQPPWHWRNQLLGGLAGSGAMLVITMLLAGMAGLVVFLAQSAVAIFLLEVVNYVEHYGLERAQRPDGRYERVEVVHSWNASERFTNWFLFNLQRHSHHHVEHHRRYQVLRHMDESPQLPTGYAGMVLLALVPAIWMKIMNARLEQWRAQRLGS